MRGAPLIHRLRAGLRGLLRRRQIDQDLDDELQAYIEAATEWHLRDGLTREQALRAARMDVGSIAAVKDGVREAGVERLVDGLWQDVRYTVRALRGSPAFTMVAVTSLALGIGASTAIFTLLNAVALRPLPVPHPEELVEVGARGSLISFPMYRDLRDAQQVFSGFAVTSLEPSIRLTIDAPADERVRVDNVRVSRATGNYFTLLGIRPAAGRFFTPAEDRDPGSSESAGSVIVLSHAFWQRQFDGDPAVIGRTVLVDRSPCRVIGVTPRGFTGERAGAAPDAWVPMLPFSPENLLEGRGGTFGSRLARLKPGLTREQAEPAMTALFQRLLAAEGLIDKERIPGTRIVLGSASAGVLTLVGITYAIPLRIVMAVALLVLLIACANIANLLISRGVRRRAEIDVRLAIGCGRGRLIRQLLTESLTLSFAGAIAGIAVAYLGTTVLIRMVDFDGDPMWLDLSPDWRVLLFLLGTAVLTGIAFGIAPALRTSRAAPASPLGARAGRGVVRSTQRFSHTLVAMQVALSLLLLVSAGLLVSSLRNLQGVERGFETDRVIVVDLQHTPTRTDPAALSRAAEDIQTRVAAIPGVESASVSWILLFSGRDQRTRLEIAGFSPPPRGREGAAFIDPQGVARARFNVVTPDYFRTVGMTLVEGRGLENRDGASAPRVAVVNESMARAYFGSAHAVGRTFTIPSGPTTGFGAPPPLPGEPIEIVGVVRDAKFNDLREAMRPMFYLPLAQSPRALRSMEIRTRQPLGTLATAVRQALADVAPDVMVRNFVTLSEQVERSVSAERLVGRLASFFGAAALLLACIGLYGVLTYSVTQRTGEIGVRLALGATPRAIVRLVLGNSLGVVAMGVAFGLLLALAATRLLSALLYGVTPTDSGAFVSAIALLLVTAGAAAFIPSWRAARVDPTLALRE